MDTRKKKGIPDDLLLDFFQKATRALTNLNATTSTTDEDESSTTTNPISLQQIRARILNAQIECLRLTVAENASSSTDVSVEQLQEAVAHCSSIPRQEDSSSSTSSLNNNNNNNDSIIQRAVERMNQAARQSFCRLCLQTDWSTSNSTQIIDSGEMKDADILEFCGLCEQAVQLPQVWEFLCTGKQPLWPETAAATTTVLLDCGETIFPQKRLECIQRVFLVALGYDPDFGTREIKRRFYENSGEEENRLLRSTFSSMAARMQAVLTEVTASVTRDTFLPGNDDDGVTRVVSVQYSEKFVDEKTGKEIKVVAEDAAPRPETMMEQQQVNDDDTEDMAAKHRQEQLRVAREASLVQQEILGELLSLRDEEREARLSEAKQVTETFLQKAMQIPPGPERVSFFTSIDPKTQRFMIMHKLWEGMLAENDGQPPTLK